MRVDQQEGRELDEFVMFTARLDLSVRYCQRVPAQRPAN